MYNAHNSKTNDDETAHRLERHNITSVQEFVVENCIGRDCSV